MCDADPSPNQPPSCNDSPVAQSVVGTEFVMSGCLTVDDAIAAHRLATRGFWPRIALSALIVVTFSAVLVAVSVSSRPYSPQAANVMLFIACVIFPALIVVPLAIDRFRLRRFARKRYGIFAPTHSRFSLSNIVITSEDAKSELQWGLFSCCIANETVAIMYFKNANQYMILAKQKLEDPSHWGAFLLMLQSRLNGYGDSKQSSTDG